LQQLFDVKRKTQAKGSGRQGDKNILTLEREVTEGWRQQGERASLLVPFAKYLFYNHIRDYYLNGLYDTY
jgi:hypothetical protein